MSNKGAPAAPKNESKQKFSYIDLASSLTFDCKEPKSIKPAEYSLNASLAFRLKRFSPLVLPLSKSDDLPRGTRRSKSIEPLISPDILKLNCSKPATADMTERIKRFTRRSTKNIKKPESPENGFADSLKSFDALDDNNHIDVTIIENFDMEEMQESSNEIINFTLEADNDLPRSPVVKGWQDHKSGDLSSVDLEKGEKKVKLPKERLEIEEANSDIATDGDLFIAECIDKKPTKPIYVIPEFPSAKLFINQAQHILKDAGPKTRKNILERETLLQKQKGIFNKYAETRKVLGYGPDLGVQSDYQSNPEGPPFITVSLRQPLGVKKAAESRLKRDRSPPKGINVITNSTKKSKLPDIAYI